jgi:Electron transfer DM13
VARDGPQRVVASYLRGVRSLGAPTVAVDEKRRRRWPWIAGGATALTGLGVFVLVWFQPQKLWIDDRVDQAVPSAGPSVTPDPPPAAGEAQDAPAAAPTTAPQTTAPPPPIDLANGTFVSLDHATSGTARVLRLADGRRFVRFEGFETENGPDLFVYLSTNPAGGPEGAFDDTFHNLGRLVGNIGDQNYEIPADLSLDGYASVVVWCDRFDSAFGAADLAAA